MTEPYFTDRTHVLISGVTGSGDAYGGKTATANWWLDSVVPSEFDYGFYFDPKGTATIQGHTVHGLTRVGSLVREGTRTFHVQPGWEERDKAHTALMQFVDEHLDGSALLIHDEAYSYEGRLEWATATAGNAVPAKSIVVSQDVWDLPRNVRSNTPVKVWVGPYTDEAKRYFEVMGIKSKGETIRERHTEPYMWSVIDGDTVDTYNPVPSKYA